MCGMNQSGYIMIYQCESVWTWQLPNISRLSWAAFGMVDITRKKSHTRRRNEHHEDRPRCGHHQRICQVSSLNVQNLANIHRKLLNLPNFHGFHICFHCTVCVAKKTRAVPTYASWSASCPSALLGNLKLPTFHLWQVSLQDQFKANSTLVRSAVIVVQI